MRRAESSRIHAALVLALIGTGAVRAGEGQGGAVPDSQTDAIIDDILRRRDAIDRSARVGEDPELIVFMDFDGTIIRGDITEGAEAGETDEGVAPAFMGLSEKAVREGVSATWSGDDQADDHVKDYEARLAKDPLKAYMWLADEVCNLPAAKAARLPAVVAEHFRSVLRPQLFESSMRIIRRLSREGIHVYVISASPHPFVLGAHTVIPEIPPARMSGIDRTRDARGRLVDPLFNYGRGKTERMMKILAAKPHPTVVLAGFGNSWSTDGHLLMTIAKQWGGLGVMINGGPAPEVGHGLLEVAQKRVLGKALGGGR